MLKTFPLGGVHPPENKITAGIPIEYLPVPESVIIPLSQHIGTPANPVVNKGDTVKTGQVIAAGKGFVSANIHSSVSGKVNKIDLAADSTRITNRLPSLLMSWEMSGLILLTGAAEIVQGDKTFA